MRARRIGLWGLGVLWALFSLPVFAQPEITTEARDKAKALFEEADKYYKLGEYETALSMYREAYLLTNESVILFNVGQCYRLLNKYKDAIHTYQSFLLDVPDTPLRADVEQLISEMEEAIRSGAWIEAPQEAPPPETPSVEQEKSRSAWRFALPAGLAVLSGTLGVQALLVRQQIKDAGQTNSALQRRGALLALGADASLVAAGLTLFLALKKKKGPDVGVSANTHSVYISLSFSQGMTP